MESFEGEKREGELPLGQIIGGCRSQTGTTAMDETKKVDRWPVYEKPL